MTKLALLLLIAFLAPSIRAETDYSREVQCFQQVADGFGKGLYHPLKGGRDAIYMLKDGNVGGVPDNAKSNAGFFLIEDQKLQFCPLPWSNSKAANVKFTDSRGETVKLTRRLAEPYFNEGGEWLTSYFPTNCEDVTGSTRSSKMLRDIFTAAIKKQMDAGKPYDLCMNTPHTKIRISDLVPGSMRQGPATQNTSNAPVEK